MCLYPAELLFLARAPFLPEVREFIRDICFMAPLRELFLEEICGTYDASNRGYRFTEHSKLVSEPALRGPRGVDLPGTRRSPMRACKFRDEYFSVLRMSFVQKKAKPTGSDISFKQRRDSIRWMRPVDPKDALLPSLEQRPSRALASLKSAGSRVMTATLVISAFQNKPKSVFDGLGKETEERPEMVLVDPDSTLDETADLVLQALRKPSSERTDDDLQTILQATADSKFFQRLSPEEHREICRVIQPAFVPKDTVVFQQGEEGKSVYLIYHGAAKVYVAYTKPAKAASWGLMAGLGPTKLGAQAATSTKLEYIEPNVDGEEENEEAKGASEEAKVAKLGSCVCVLEDGDSFGELVLMNAGKRQASVRTAMPTHLLKIDKEVYDRSLHEMHEAELDRRVKFVRSIFIFGNWSEEDLRGISKVMTKRRYEKNTTIIAQAGRFAYFQTLTLTLILTLTLTPIPTPTPTLILTIAQGGQTDAMYLLKKGSCRVIKRMQLTQRQQGMLGLAPPSPRGRGGSGRGGGSSRQPSRAPPEETLLEICELPVRHYFGERAILEPSGYHLAITYARVTPRCLAFLVPTAHSCPLPTAHCPLPTAHCLLPTAYR